MTQRTAVFQVQSKIYKTNAVLSLDLQFLDLYIYLIQEITLWCSRIISWYSCHIFIIYGCPDIWYVLVFSLSLSNTVYIALCWNRYCDVNAYRAAVSFIMPKKRRGFYKFLNPFCPYFNVILRVWLVWNLTVLTFSWIF